MSSTRHSPLEIRARQIVRPLRPSDTAPQSRPLRIHGMQPSQQHGHQQRQQEAGPQPGTNRPSSGHSSRPSPSALEDKARRRQRAAYKAPGTGATQRRKNSAPENRKAKARPGIESTIGRKANTITDRG